MTDSQSFTGRGAGKNEFFSDLGNGEKQDILNTLPFRNFIIADE